MKKMVYKICLFVAFVALEVTSLAQAGYVDMGLPSGTYWKKENVGGDSYVYRKADYYFTYQEAVRQFGNKLPTKEQYDELLKYCKWERNLKDNDNGYKVIGPNGNYIIMERVGYTTPAGWPTDVGQNGFYWSSTPDGSEAWGLLIMGFSHYMSSSFKSQGGAVRLVISRDEARRLHTIEEDQ